MSTTKSDDTSVQISKFKTYDPYNGITIKDQQDPVHSFAYETDLGNPERVENIPTEGSISGFHINDRLKISRPHMKGEREVVIIDVQNHVINVRPPRALFFLVLILSLLLKINAQCQGLGLAESCPNPNPPGPLNLPINSPGPQKVPNGPYCTPEKTNGVIVNTDFICCFTNCSGTPNTYTPKRAYQILVQLDLDDPGTYYNYPTLTEYKAVYTSISTSGTGFLCLDYTGARSTNCEDNINKTNNIFTYCAKDNHTRDFWFNQTITPVTVNTTGCLAPGICYCMTIVLTETPYINTGSTLLKGNSELVEEVSTYFGLTGKPGPILIYSDTESVAHDSMLQTTQITEADSIGSFYATYTNGVVIIHFGEDGNRTVLLRKISYIGRFDMNSTDLTITLPPSVLETSGYLYLTIYEGSIVVGEDQFYIVGFFFCRLANCIFCSDAFTNWHCLSTYYKTMIILIFILLFLLTLGLCPFAWQGIWYIVTYGIWPIIKLLFTCIFGFHKSRLASRIMSILRRGKEGVQNELTPLTKDDTVGIQMNDQSDLPRPRMQNKKILTARSILNIALLTFFYLPMFYCQCTSGSEIISTVNTCVKNGASKTCGLKFTMTSTLPYIRSTNCFTLKDVDGNIIATGNFTYLYMVDRYSLTYQYSTISWVPYVQSVFHCDHTGSCPGKCALANLQTDKSIGNIITDPQITTWPGRTICERSGGCASDGCFYCTPGCIFSAFSIVPKGSSVDVFSLNQRKHDPAIQFQIIFPNGTYFSTTILAKSRPLINVPFSSGNLQFKFLGSYAFDSTEFQGKYLVGRPDLYKLMHACEPNVPCTGLVGDVQTSIPNNYQHPSANGFIISEDMWLIAKQRKSHSYTFSEPSFKYWETNEDVLPKVLNSDRWFVDAGGYLTSNLTQGPQIVVQLTTDVPIIYETLADVVCPTAKLVSANGCFSCDDGFSITISIKSTCSAGIITIAADKDYVSLSTISAYISTDFTDLLISGYTTKQENNFKLTFFGTNVDDVVDVAFTAFFVPEINNQSFIQPNVRPYDTTTDWKKQIKTSIWKNIQSFLDKIVKGVASWWEYLIFSVVGIVSILLTLWLGSMLMVRIKNNYASLKNRYDNRTWLKMKKSR